MKIAIIGGSGFVGQNLITYFLKKNIRIFATYNSNNKIKKKFSNVIWRKLDIKKDKIERYFLSLFISCRYILTWYVYSVFSYCGPTNCNILEF